MSITRKLAAFAAKFFALPTSDDKVYGIKNGEFFEVPAGGGADDGVTIANLCSKVINDLELVSPFSPLYYKKGVGAAQLFNYGHARTQAWPEYGTVGSGQTGVAAGAATTVAIGTTTVNTGATTTGYRSTWYSLRPAIQASERTPYQPIVTLQAAPQYMAAAVRVSLSNLSDASEAFAADVFLLGVVADSDPISANSSGIIVTYTHTENAGKYVIKYRNASGSLASINTNIAPSTDISAPVTLSAIAERLTSSAATVTVKVGSETHVLTDTSANANMGQMNCQLTGRITKSAGTTSRQLRMDEPVLAWAATH